MEAKSRVSHQVESLQGCGEWNIQNIIKEDSNKWKRRIFQQVGKPSTHLKEK